MRATILFLVLAGCMGEGLPDDEAPPPADGHPIAQTWLLVNHCPSDAGVRLAIANGKSASTVVPAGESASFVFVCPSGAEVCASLRRGTGDETPVSCVACGPGGVAGAQLRCD